jgi:hypothetical protein
MGNHRTTLIRFGILLFTLIMLSAATVSPALAVDKPAIDVSVVWRPATQLTTIDHDSDNIWDDVDSDTNWYGPADDDFRYVEAEIYVTTSVPFWAVDLTCTVDPDVLVGYTNVDTSGSPVENHDDQDMLVWGDAWDDRGGPSEAGNSGVYNGATGEMDLTATLTGDWHEPLGFYGYTDTFLLATLRYKTASLADSDDTDIRCSGRFLNRDGEDVAKPKFAKGTSLDVLTGYTINGTISYQGYSKMPRGSEPTVDCVWDMGESSETHYPGTADSSGVWSVTTRVRGHYDCFFEGQVPSPGGGGYPQHLLAREGVSLGWSYYTEWYTDFYFLPVELKDGNVDVTPSSQPHCYSDYRGEQGQDVYDFDLTAVTTSYEINAGGDANGDGWTDEEDLAIVGASYGYCEDDHVDHLIYDLPRDYDAYQNSRIWLGDYRPQATGVTQLVPGPKEGRDLWATLSPDGTRVAFVRSEYDRSLGADRYGLYVADVTGSKPKATAILPKDFSFYDGAFAPSWSPDGQRIAFVCSWYYHGSGHLYPMSYGHLCLIDADGGNFQVLKDPDNGDDWVYTQIWPPAWDDTYKLVFAHNYGGGSNIYRYFLDTNSLTLYDDPDIPGNSNDIPNGSDMPIVHSGHLTYRYESGGDRTLRWARINCETYSWPYPCVIDDYSDPNTAGWSGYPHTDVMYDTGGGVYDHLSTDVDYYEIEPGGNALVLYETGGYQFWLHWVETWHGTYPTDWPEWRDPSSAPVFWLTGQVGNPSCSGGPPCDLFALRNTVDWAQRP